MSPDGYAALIRASLARLDVLSPAHADRVREDLGLGLALAEVMGRGLVRTVTHAGRAALVFTFGQISTALDDAAAYRRLTDAEGDQP